MGCEFSLELVVLWNPACIFNSVRDIATKYMWRQPWQPHHVMWWCTWSLDLQGGISYGWTIGTISVFSAIVEVMGPKHHNSLRLVWVPGHHGIPGNEVADVLAMQASAQPYIGPEPVLGVTCITVCNAVRHWSIWEQNRLWCQTPGCRQTKPCLKELTLASPNMPYV